MSDTTTRGIRIQVRTGYLPDHSSPREGQFRFQYDITISNVGSETAQLVSREWIITDADGGVERVKGGGVVGKFPVLKPGVGSMHGSYQMVTAGGETFDALITPFTLAIPNALN